MGQRDQTFTSYETPFGKLGAAICFDFDFLDTMSLVARTGATIVAVPSSDWPGIAHRHYPHATMRAIENRVAVVKADTMWDSMSVDSTGTMHADCVSESGGYCILVSEIKHGTGTRGSLFANTGDIIGILNLVVYAFV